MEAEKFLKSLDKAVPQLIFLVGEEPFYADKIIAKVKEKWFLGEADENIRTFAGEPSVAEFMDVISGNSFFSQKTLVIIEDSRMLLSGKMGDKERDEYIKIFSAIPGDCCIVIKSAKPDKRLKNYKLLSGLAEAIVCDKIKSHKIREFLLKEAALCGYKWENEALTLITEYLSTLEDISLYFIEQEMEKLSLYAGERKIWTKDDVEKMFSKTTGVSGFSLLKALVQKDSVKAINVMHEQIVEGDDPLKIIGLIAFQIRRMLIAQKVLADGGNREDVIAATKTNVYFVDELIRDCKNIKNEKVRKMMLDLSDISRGVYAGGRTVSSMEEAIIAFCQ